MAGSYDSRMMRLLATSAALLLAGAPAVSRGAEEAAYAAAARTITADDLQRHVDILADDTFEGREAGSRGGRAAGNYLMQMLQKFGLRGAGVDAGYYQSFGADYRNILAYIEGADPELRDEVVLVGAHYDHVGYGSPRNSFGPTGYIHNGADDNASGTAVLLELVEAFAELPEPPRRTIVFAFWDGEEKGLLGSKYWTANPTIPLEQIKLAINADMLGRLRDDRLEVFGTRTGYGLRRLVAMQNRDLDLRLDFTWDMKANSDHHSFFRRGIPVVMFHTGLHDDYHRPSDDAHKVEAPGMQRVGRLLFSVTSGAADLPELDGFRSYSRRESPTGRRSLERPTAKSPPRLGVRWDATENGEDGLVLTEVVSNSAAAEAELRVGDRLLRINGKAIEDQERFRLEILAAKESVRLTVQRQGDEAPREIDVQLQGRPTRLGIAWRQDDAEPQSVVLTQVTSGSAAHAADLRVGDRIYEIAGQAFTGSDELKQIATTSPSPLEMLVERQGRLSLVTVNVLPFEKQAEDESADAPAEAESTE